MMHSHAVGLWMRDRPVSETSTCRKHNTRNKHTSMSPGWIRTLHPSKWAAAELCLTQRSHKDRKSAIMKSRIETKYTAFVSSSTSLPSVVLSASQASSRLTMRALVHTTFISPTSQHARCTQSTTIWSPQFCSVRSTWLLRSPASYEPQHLNNRNKTYLISHSLFKLSNIPRYVCGSRNGPRMYLLVSHW